MRPLRKRVFITAGYNTVYFGSGREGFDPNKPMRGFEEYLLESAQGTCAQIKNPDIDEGVIGSFMSGRFLKQANLPGFLPFMIPSLQGKPCTAVEGACGTGGRALATAMRSILADMADVVFVAAFEIQNSMKAVYGADVLAGAAYYHQERKKGGAFFFPGLFAERAGAYYDRYGYEMTRHAMAKWYEQSILNARKNPKAQEYHNKTEDLLALGLTPPNPKQFVPYLNLYDCSKVSDGASSLLIVSEEGLNRLGIALSDAVEIVGVGEAEGNITLAPEDLTSLSTTKLAVQKAFTQAGIVKEDLGLLELHDCFSITALLALEAIGFCNPGKAAQFILEEQTNPEGLIPTNLSGGLGGFGHPTGATGVRQMVDLLHQLTGEAANQIKLKKTHGMMISMGGNDKTLTSFVVKATEGV
ncbi:MAG: 3-ketoacyl-CoA thiolase [Parachlamydiaceae bacterium]|nr:3-ketoacyl-CoA thiolase [Parachlamydiaceae bacterium]